jgi:hypothetical protein
MTCAKIMTPVKEAFFLLMATDVTTTAQFQTRRFRQQCYPTFLPPPTLILVYGNVENERNLAK